METVDYVGASLLKALRPLDVVGLVEAGAQFEQRGNFLAVFCSSYQGFCQMGLAGKAVQRDLNRDDAEGSFAASRSRLINGSMLS